MSKAPRRFTKKLPLVEVIWADCLLFTGGWEAHSDVMRQVRDINQRSVGYILQDNKKRIVLAASLSQGGNVFGAHVIPAAQIISRRNLK
jgi:hypothetical protein